jgi:hypothetical protein
MNPDLEGLASCFGFSKMINLPTELEFMQGKHTRASQSTEGNALAMKQTRHQYRR